MKLILEKIDSEILEIPEVSISFFVSSRS